MNALLPRKRSRDLTPKLPVLRRPGDDRWISDANRLQSLHRALQADGAAAHPFSRARLPSQELFLSVVMEWQKAEPSDMSDASSDGYMTPSSEDLEAEFQQSHKARKTVDDVSPTSVQDTPRDVSPLRLDYITQPVKMIGAYTPSARRALLQKYMAKRARRLSQHKVRYGVRKTLANARPRVKGRFVKTVQPLTAAAVEAQQKAQQAQQSN